SAGIVEYGSSIGRFHYRAATVTYRQERGAEFGGNRPDGAGQKSHCEPSSPGRNSPTTMSFQSFQPKYCEERQVEGPEPPFRNIACVKVSARHPIGQSN